MRLVQPTFIMAKVLGGEDQIWSNRLFTANKYCTEAARPVDRQRSVQPLLELLQSLIPPSLLISLMLRCWEGELKQFPDLP